MTIRLPRKNLLYTLLAFLCAGVSLLVGWSSYADRINHNFYDQYFHQRGSRTPADEIVIVAIDDATLARYGALPLNRSVLAKVIRVIQSAQPRLIAIDLLLTDVSSPESDHELARALSEKPHGIAPFVLATALEVDSGSHWLLPLAEFSGPTATLGHVHADPDADGVSRQVLLSKEAHRQRYWALALESWRVLLGHPKTPVTETDDALEIAGESSMARIPANRRSHRALLINYAGREGTFPQISLARLLDEPRASALQGKVVFLGVTAQGTGDRLFTPFSSGVGMPGVEIHANILHTLLKGEYLTTVGNFAVLLAVLGIVGITSWVLGRFHGPVLIFLLTGIGAAVLLIPYRLFLNGWVWPAFSLLVPFGMTLAVCGTYQLLSARRRFAESETRRRRSQQQFEMATHEIRTPLTAIQASSELLSRYPLDESRRKQMIELICDESQRLGKLVERFLSVERLSTGEVELQRHVLNLSSLLTASVERMRTTAERKGIQLLWENESSSTEIEGDQELLEFAVSNLLTNAVKYSPSGTVVGLSLKREEERVRIEVSDSGPGLTREEHRSIFDRFYRTKSAQHSEAPGFGLGLGIAREIARHHGGDLIVDSKPGSGSRFTIMLPVRASSLRRNPVAW